MDEKRNRASLMSQKVAYASTAAAINMTGTRYDESQATLNVQLHANAGLIHVTDYYASTTATETTTGGVEGHVDSTSIKEGSGGTEIQQSETEC